MHLGQFTEQLIAPGNSQHALGKRPCNLFPLKNNLLVLPGDVNNDDLISAGEIQLGVDWRRRFASGASLLFTVAAEGQYWNNVGTGGPANNAPYDEGNYQNARPQDADLGFFGVTVGTGFLF